MWPGRPRLGTPRRRRALGAAQARDAFLPAGKIDTRHENSRLKSGSALWTAILFVPFVTIPDVWAFELMIRAGRLWRALPPLACGGRNAQNKPN
jgi:hypothetical protein